jgi:hypothetical protein
MPEALENNDILEVKFYSTLGTQGAINRIYYRVGLPPVGATHTDQNASDRLNTVFKPLFRVLMSQEASWRGVSVQILTRDGFDPAYTSSPDPGLEATVAIAPQTAGLIALRTGKKGRSARGRMYVPWPGEGHNTTGGVPSEAYVADLQALGEALRSVQVVIAGGLNLSLEPVINSTLLVEFHPFTSAVARPYWASMRSRSNFAAKNTLPI